MAVKNISVLSGDGIGPEVMAQAIKVLDAVCEVYGHTFNYDYQLIGGVAIEETGQPLPDATTASCKQSDAVLLGAIGHPKYSDPTMKVRPEQGLLAIRKELGLYCNVRPVTAYDGLLEMSPLKNNRIKDVDFVIYRELIGGIYFGESGRSADGNYAYDKCEYHDYEIERIVRQSFEEASKRRKKVTLVDKANVLESSRLWREVFDKVAQDYPNIEKDYLYIDNACMQMILNPRRFDVVVTSNIFGDIISDEGSVIAGSLGLLPSASIGEQYALFEPVHGSWPEGAGQDIANPFAMVLSTAMMLQHFGLLEESTAVRQAVSSCIEEGYLTPDLNESDGKSCSEVGTYLSDLLTTSRYGVII